ncbi:NOL1/NOP2/sun family putative RNA methylase [Paenibacillus thalictri]|uniref:NOL1/NOP2/sun family putative RNA methylase n=2 Tax=Paenibacillus thalictri TaxID=2527873 RepID=A0A4Q9DYD2_9BACL|nr:NOL1/NOP2/sun family putative RNA methylase [Paenibacillus thalictri]
MGIQLPKAFSDKMKRLLGTEYADFLASYDDPRWFGLRVNTLKLPAEAFQRLSSFRLTPIPWTSTGFYYEDGDRPGKHPYYHAGLYYIQEPSAMAPAELLDAVPGDRVLDLCAAPGGKSTQIAAKLQGEGLLVVNDIHADRVKALVKNLELAGVRNAVVLNERPDKLTGPFAAYFDKILIDAPCSGEGMFRKDEEMAKQWQPDHPQHYAAMQRELLDQAAEMLKPGGRIVYSTCTFSPEENEAMIAQFAARHPEFMIEPIPAAHGFRYGILDWADEQQDADEETGAGAWNSLTGQSAAAVKGTVRLWPHELKGEGHFVASLRKTGDHSAHVENMPDRLETKGGGNGEERKGRPFSSPGLSAEPEYIAATAKPERTARNGKAETRLTAMGGNRSTVRSDKKGRSKPHEANEREEIRMDPLQAFWQEHLTLAIPEQLTAYGDHIYAQPAGLPDLSGIRVIRPGWYLGSVHKQRFEPSHALALGLRRGDYLRVLDIPSDSPDTLRYLKGETLEMPKERLDYPAAIGPKGYCLVCIGGFPAGWGKWVDGIVKNEYPPGWRWT